jgi:hypothetical protein
MSQADIKGAILEAICNYRFPSSVAIDLPVMAHLEREAEAYAAAVVASLPASAQGETVNAVERSLVRQIVLGSTPGEGEPYRLRERLLAEIDKLPILDAAASKNIQQHGKD